MMRTGSSSGRNRRRDGFGDYSRRRGKTIQRNTYFERREYVIIRNMRSKYSLAGLLLAILVASVNATTNDDSAATLARDVTIYRDTYGVPHVFGRTDASTAFGFA